MADSNYIGRVTMPRGDIRVVHFSVGDSTGENTNIEFTEIYITFKNNCKTNDYLFQKKLSDGSVIATSDGEYQFTIKPEDTDDLQFGTYVFDIELIYGSQLKQTFIGDLELTKEVTFASNEG